MSEREEIQELIAKTRAELERLEDKLGETEPDDSSSLEHVGKNGKFYFALEPDPDAYLSFSPPLRVRVPIGSTMLPFLYKEIEKLSSSTPATASTYKRDLEVSFKLTGCFLKQYDTKEAIFSLDLVSDAKISTVR